jgi:hypothetical protein
VRVLLAQQADRFRPQVGLPFRDLPGFCHDLTFHFEGADGPGFDCIHVLLEGTAAVEAAGTQLRYLPPYSPDYIPIEHVFAKMKALLRENAARTVQTLWDAFGHLLDQFIPDECGRYIRHAGYG